MSRLSTLLLIFLNPVLDPSLTAQAPGAAEPVRLALERLAGRSLLVDITTSSRGEVFEEGRAESHTATITRRSFVDSRMRVDWPSHASTRRYLRFDVTRDRIPIDPPLPGLTLGIDRDGDDIKLKVHEGFRLPRELIEQQRLHARASVDDLIISESLVPGDRVQARIEPFLTLLLGLSSRPKVATANLVLESLDDASRSALISGSVMVQAMRRDPEGIELDAVLTGSLQIEIDLDRRVLGSAQFAGHGTARGTRDGRLVYVRTHERASLSTRSQRDLDRERKSTPRHRTVRRAIHGAGITFDVPGSWWTVPEEGGVHQLRCDIVAPEVGLQLMPLAPDGSAPSITDALARQFETADIKDMGRSDGPSGVGPIHSFGVTGPIGPVFVDVVHAPARPILLVWITTPATRRAIQSVRERALRSMRLL